MQANFIKSFKIFTAALLIALLAAGSFEVVWASDDFKGAIDDFSQRSARYDNLASSLQETTGMAISPVLIMFVNGLYLNITTPEGRQLPLHASPLALTIMGLFLLAVFAKDLAPVPGPLKSALSAVEEAVMPIGALSGFLIIIPSLFAAMQPLSSDLVSALSGLIGVGTAYAQAGSAAETSSSALIPLLGGLLAICCGLMIYWVVWCVSNTVNVLCIIAPSPAVPLLKAIRLLVLMFLAAMALVHPLLGLLATLLVIVVCLLIVRWAFRLTVWGVILSFDLLGRRWRKRPGGGSILAFGGSGAPKPGAKRVLGLLHRQEGRFYFSYRRYLIFSCGFELPADGLTVGRCLLSPILLTDGRNGKERELLTFPLRFRGHEDYLAEKLKVYEVRDAGLKSGFTGAVAWLKNLWKTKDVDQCFPI